MRNIVMKNAKKCTVNVIVHYATLFSQSSFSLKLYVCKRRVLDIFILFLLQRYSARVNQKSRSYFHDIFTNNVKAGELFSRNSYQIQAVTSNVAIHRITPDFRNFDLKLNLELLNLKFKTLYTYAAYGMHQNLVQNVQNLEQNRLHSTFSFKQKCFQVTK